MPITLEQIIEEVRHWPPDKIAELMERLTEDLHSGGPDVDAAWRTEVARRIEDIRSGRVPGVPGDEVNDRLRNILGR